MRRSFSKNTFLVLVALAGIFLVISGIVSLKEKELVLNNDKLTQGETSAKRTCIDPDVSEGEGAIYVKGDITFIDEQGKQKILYDSCTESNEQVNELTCYENPAGSRNYVNGVTVANCQAGCRDGACLKTETTSASLLKSAFVPQISWKDSNAIFSLTEVSLGKIPAPPNLASYTQGKNYKAGESIYALVLKLKIAVSQYGCVPMNLRLISNEEGDMQPPSNRQFSFPDTGGCAAQANTTYSDQNIVFVVPEPQKEFLISTGSTPNIHFTIHVLSGKLEVRKAPTEG